GFAIAAGATWSAHAAPAGCRQAHVSMSIPATAVCTHPAVGEQTSWVHASPSSQGRGPFPAHVAATSVVVVGTRVVAVLLEEVVELDVIVLAVVVVGGRDVDEDVDDVVGCVDAVVDD